jgi:hypothetical protein
MLIRFTAQHEGSTMSAIGAIAGGLSQFIQSLNPSGAASPAQNASSGSTASTSGHHHHGGGFAKLADAITSALQSASNSSSGSASTDANQTITQALTKIFQNGSLGSASSTDDTDAAQDASDPSATDATNTLPASFVQTLKSFGVTAQQFQTDLTNALNTAQQSGNFDPSSVLKNFPPGSIVDAIG